MRGGLTDAAETAREAASAGRARGARAARAVAALVDGRRESPGESLTSARIHEHGLTAPSLQHVLRDARGFVARVDFWWPGARVVGEFDGRVKYRLDDVAGAADAGDVLWREKLREDRLRTLGLKVVRWTWDDAWRGAPLVARLRAAGVR